MSVSDWMTGRLAHPQDDAITRASAVNIVADAILSRLLCPCITTGPPLEQGDDEAHDDGQAGDDRGPHYWAFLIPMRWNA